MNKNIFVDKNIFSGNKIKKNFLKIWARSSMIPFCLINKTVLIHNGKDFRKLYITREKVGFKFGEFSFTRKRNVVKIAKNDKK